MSGRFEVYEDSAGKFRFRLRTSSGEVVASGQGYATKESAIRGCRSILKVAEGTPVAVTAEASGGAFRPPTQRNGADGSYEGRVQADTGPEDVSENEAVARRFRFAGGMSAEGDLAARSGEIIRDEFRPDR